jgi:hypothetical protein
MSTPIPDKPPANPHRTNTIIQETSPLLAGMNFADSRLIYPRGRKDGDKEDKKKTRMLASDPVRLSSSPRALNQTTKGENNDQN